MDRRRDTNFYKQKQTFLFSQQADLGDIRFN